MCGPLLVWQGKVLGEGGENQGRLFKFKVTVGERSHPHRTQAIGTGLALTACLGVDRYVTVTYIF